MTDLELQKGQEILKSLTVEDLRSPKGQEKFNQAAGKYIRSKIKKTSLFYKVIPPQSVTEDELVDIRGSATGRQPDLRCFMPSVPPSESVKAMLMDMRGKPVPNYTDGTQPLLIPMGTVKTKWFEKTAVELSASGSLLRLVEEMASWEVKERDRKFLKYCDLAVQESGQVLRESGPLQKEHFRKIQHPAQKNGIKPKIVLLAKAVMDLDLEKYVAEISRISRIEYIRSQDDDVLAPTVVWSFPAPDFLGYNLYCGDYKVCGKQERVDTWSFQGSERMGAGIGNINGVTKLILGFMAGEIKIPDDFDRMGGPNEPTIPAEYRADVIRAVDICKEEGCRDVFVLGSDAVSRHGSQAGLDIGIRGCPTKHFYRLLGRLMEELAYPVGLIDLDRETRIAEFLAREGQLVHVG